MICRCSPRVAAGTKADKGSVESLIPPLPPPLLSEKGIMRKQIFITQPDMYRLQQLVGNPFPLADTSVEALGHELERAIVVAPEKISRKVVTMNSRVRIHDLDRGSELVVTVVFPFESNAELRRMSVLAPLGTALLGSRVNETVSFEAPGGPRRVKIVGIEYQPESAARDRHPARVFQNSGSAA